MAILKNVGLKTSTIDEITANFDGAQGVVVVNYSGLTVEQDTQLRKQLREAGVVYKVYKNTLVKRVVAGTEFESIADTLEGTNAIAFSKTDATAPARILANFAKTAEKLEIKGGLMEGKAVTAAEVEAIASLPSREELLAHIAAAINGVAKALAVCVNGVPQGLAQVTKAVADQKAA